MSSTSSFLGYYCPTSVTALGCAGIIMLAGCSDPNSKSYLHKSNSKPMPIEKTVSTTPVVEQPIVEKMPVSGSKSYKRCAACHLPTGDGVPGAFPPLRGELSQFLNSEAGKDYLVLVAFYGVAGEISSGGINYSGIMPPQGGMSPEKVTAVLNYIMTDFNGIEEGDSRLFTSKQVTAIRDKHGRLSGRKIIALRPVVKPIGE